MGQTVELMDRITLDGEEHLTRARGAGRGVILFLNHLGDPGAIAAGIGLRGHAFTMAGNGMDIMLGDVTVSLDFIEKLDPALKRINDPLEPASVVVHTHYHADPLFVPREKGLYWADPVECLLDLYDARLDIQAGQFLEALRMKRPSNP